jgi:FtsP/CotA-like multicopper oxidase with cupredoxin domain
MGLLPQEARAASQTPIKLAVVSRTIDIDGRAATVLGLLQPDGTPGLHVGVDEHFNVELANKLSDPTIIHWHGLTPPWEMDGVPDMPMPMLKPGERRSYLFPAGKPGTHWMHAHTLQEQALLAAPLIVRGKQDLARDEQEVVVLLHDFSFTPAEELLAKLKSEGGMRGMNMQGMNMQGMNQMNMRGMGGGMMMGMDLNDIEYDAYLANDRTLNDPQVVRTERNGRVRLRIINGATATAFTIDTGVLEGEITAVDGQNIEPINSRQFPLSMGQRVDIRLRVPKEGGTFPVFALREGGPQRTGIILASPGATVARLADQGEAPGPIVSLDMERRLAAARPLPARQPDRDYTVDLAGGMHEYAWHILASRELVATKGERIVIEMRNHSMMTHPMHLHGHHFQVVAINGVAASGAVRDTVAVPPMSRLAFAFDAGNPGGGWAFHCHHLYHMASGMMTAIRYVES